MIVCLSGITIWSVKIDTNYRLYVRFESAQLEEYVTVFDLVMCCTTISISIVNDDAELQHETVCYT